MFVIHNSALSEKLHLDSELTLYRKGQKIVRQRQTVHKHQQFLTGKSSKETIIEEVTKNYRSNNHLSTNLNLSNIISQRFKDAFRSFVLQSEE